MREQLPVLPGRQVRAGHHRPHNVVDEQGAHYADAEDAEVEHTAQVLVGGSVELGLDEVVVHHQVLGEAQLGQDLVDGVLAHVEVGAVALGHGREQSPRGQLLELQFHWVISY